MTEIGRDCVGARHRTLRPQLDHGWPACFALLYDIISAQPSLDAGQAQARQLKLAMSVGQRSDYRIDQILADVPRGKSGAFD